MQDNHNETEQELQELAEQEIAEEQGATGTEPEGEEKQTGLARRPSAIPDIDAALISGGGNTFSPIQAVLKASEEPLEYLVRSWMTNQEIDLIILDNSMRHAAIRGKLNPALDDFLFMTMRRSADGPNNGMRMAKEMYMGRQGAAREMRSEGQLARMTTINQEQIEQNGAQR